MRIEPVYLFVVDEDRKVFNVIGPTIQDSAWHDRAEAARRAGRNVRGFTAPATEPKELAASKYAAQIDFTFVSEPIF